MRDEFTIVEALLQVGRHLRKINGDQPMNRAYIKTEVVKLGGNRWRPDSVLPSDFCYNLQNKGSFPPKDRMFLKCNPEISDGLYVFVDLNYDYTGVVYTNPRKTAIHHHAK
jgi:hypothetical protein